MLRLVEISIQSSKTTGVPMGRRTGRIFIHMMAMPMIQAIKNILYASSAVLK